MIFIPENKRAFGQRDPAASFRIVFIQVELDVSPKLITEIVAANVTPVLELEDLRAILIVVLREPGIAKIAIAVMAQLGLIGLPVAVIVEIDDHSIDQAGSLQADDIGGAAPVMSKIRRTAAIVDDLHDVPVFSLDQSIGTSVLIQIESEAFPF